MAIDARPAFGWSGTLGCLETAIVIGRADRAAAIASASSSRGQSVLMPGGRTERRAFEVTTSRGCPER